VQRSLVGYTVAQEGAPQLSNVQCSSVGSSLDHRKNKRPWRPEFGLEGKQFVSENSNFLFWGGGGSSKAAMAGGRAAPHLAC
jgi:hypothetical protein